MKPIRFAPSEWTYSEYARLPDDGDHYEVLERAPGLVVEVLSPSSGTIDLVRKPRRYADFGVPDYWVADPAAKKILRFDFRSGFAEPTSHMDRLEWRPDPAQPGLRLDVAALFR
jgi:Uma2 family endonuclease